MCSFSSCTFLLNVTSLLSIAEAENLGVILESSLNLTSHIPSMKKKKMLSTLPLGPLHLGVYATS